MNDLRVSFCDLIFKNPIITASGTFGCGQDFEKFIDLNKLGGITVKGVSYGSWEGNQTPRIAETYGGMLNSIGLQNNGVFSFINDDLPFLKKYNTKIIVNVCGHYIEEYIKVIEVLNDEDVDMFELNISCPNLSDGGMSFGTNIKNVEEIVSKAKKISLKPLVVKLSPNVTSITEIAKAAEASGADGLSLINTLLGMKIDVKNRQPVLKRKFGGLSGPCIKPIALKMVYEVCKAVKIPVVGMGGVTNTEDALEFLMAGAKLIAIGTANLYNPFATVEIIEGLKNYLIENNLEDINQIIGVV